MKVRDVYQDAIRYEEPFMAHYIHCLLSDGKINLDDDASKIFRAQINVKKFKQAYGKNILGVNKVKIYSLKMSKNEFAFVFAECKQDAKLFFHSLFNREPFNCLEFDMDFGLLRGRQYVTFRQLRKEITKTPALAFVYRRNANEV
ncbi:hypothetical protein [Heyndrickxia coagulans]|uniref:hypothetical protein n=1 Tax=Heyndrickxia coagulans TaxID=1398 RepID=UPI0007795AD2|nr:hypothetical protein [Heyndrickxia coagulans]